MDRGCRTSEQVVTVPTTSNGRAGGAWTPASGVPKLTEGSVHVWQANLSTPGDEVLRLLSEQEHQRAARIISVEGPLMGASARRAPGAAGGLSWARSANASHRRRHPWQATRARQIHGIRFLVRDGSAQPPGLQPLALRRRRSLCAHGEGAGGSGPRARCPRSPARCRGRGRTRVWRRRARTPAEAPGAGGRARAPASVGATQGDAEVPRVRIRLMEPTRR
jgi:hypothetical protein